MRNGPRLVLALSAVSAAVCAATGIGYFAAAGRSAPPVGVWLGTLGLLGASALLATGIWQRAANGGLRILLLILVSALGGGYIAANVLGLLASSDGGIPGAPRALHWVGLGAAVVLYLTALTEASLAFLARRSPEAPEPGMGDGPEPRIV